MEKVIEAAMRNPLKALAGVGVLFLFGWFVAPLLRAEEPGAGANVSVTDSPIQGPAQSGNDNTQGDTQGGQGNRQGDTILQQPQFNGPTQLGDNNTMNVNQEAKLGRPVVKQLGMQDGMHHSEIRFANPPGGVWKGGVALDIRLSAPVARWKPDMRPFKPETFPGLSMGTLMGTINIEGGAETDRIVFAVGGPAPTGDVVIQTLSEQPVQIAPGTTWSPR